MTRSLSDGEQHLSLQKLQSETYRTPFFSFVTIFSRFSLCNREVNVSIS